jgi:hypothetical protein
MLGRIGLDFAPGTTADSMKLVQGLSASTMFDAYRMGRQAYNQSDLVVVVSDLDHENFLVYPRAIYLKLACIEPSPTRSMEHKISCESAHEVMHLPTDSDAFWLAFEVTQIRSTVICAIRAARQYESDGESVIII